LEGKFAIVLLHGSCIESRKVEKKKVPSHVVYIEIDIGMMREVFERRGPFLS
jgi:hypothetical protein